MAFPDSSIGAEPAPGISCQEPEHPSKNCNASNHSCPKIVLEKGLGEFSLFLKKQLHEHQIRISMKWFLVQEYLRNTQANTIGRSKMSPSY